jgi:glycosyltransferase involved in cell wall biosynthesis
MKENPKIAVVTNIPAPYRVLMYNAFAKHLSDNFCVFYCGKMHKDRDWDVQGIEHNHQFMKDKYVFLHGGHIYYDFSIFKQLRKFNPDIIITNTFNPTMLFAWWYAFIHRKKHVVLTDSWLLTINTLSFIHKIVRRIVFSYTHAYLAIGKKCTEFLVHYKVKKSKIFFCPLTIDIEYYKKFKNTEKKYDLMFSGQFIDRKMPLFFCQVAKKLMDRGINVKVLIIGNGPMKQDFLDALKDNKITFEYPGFIQQKELPGYYASSRIFLMPTKLDHWGLVANEALAAGTPVITCDNAGAANDLVLPGETGYVLPLDVEVWANHVQLLLSNPEIYENFQKNAEKQINNYSVNVATNNFLKMLEFLRSK